MNEKINILAKNTDFINCVNQKDLAKRMTDRSLILRFLAFYEKGFAKAQSGLKAFLNDFFEIYRDAPESKLQEFERQFTKAIRSAYTVFGQSGFRTRKIDESGNGEWGSKANAAVFQAVAVSFADYDQIQITQKADAICEEYLDLVSTDSTWVDAVTKSTGDANKIKYAFQTWSDRLRAVMQDTTPLDGTRIFSATLKRELFEQNPTCGFCGNDIKSIADAALDHENQYWRGGKTIPTNARLAHRLCNAKRKRIES